MPERQVTVVALGLIENPGRKVKSWQRETARGEAAFHGKKHIPLHFRRGAATRYGYKPRTQTYFKRFGIDQGSGWRPLVLTGGLRDAMSDPDNQRVRATSTKGATLILQGPEKDNDHYIGEKRVKTNTGLKSLRVRLKKGQRFLSKQQEVVVQIKEEITAIRSDEIEAIGNEGRRLYEGFVDRGITAAKPRRLTI